MCVAHLLFISYKFVKGFLAITFLLFIFRTETYMMYVNVFYMIRQKMRNFPIDPIIKIAHFCNGMSIDMTLPKWAIFTMGVYGEILCILSDPTEISFLST